MQLEIKEYLLLFIPALMLFFFFGRLERARVLAITSVRFARRRGMRVFTRWIPRILWVALVSSLIFYFANPVVIDSQESIDVKGRITCLVIDLSHSMRSTSLSRTGRSSFTVIQELSQVFVKRRATTDFVCLTVFGGKSQGSWAGEASIVRLPTNQQRILEASLKSISPGMVGIYTSIGEGMLVAFFALLDQELREHNVDRYLVRESLDRGDLGYLRVLVERIGRTPNRMAVLFTDGKNNAGIEPEKVFFLYRAFGVKAHFIELVSTGRSGLELEAEKSSQQKIIRGVQETGGEYFFAEKVEDVEAHYDQIDRLERAQIQTVERESLSSHRRESLIAAFTLSMILAVWQLLFPKRP